MRDKNMSFKKGLIAVIILFISLGCALLAIEYIRIAQETELSSSEGELYSKERVVYENNPLDNSGIENTTSSLEASDKLDQELINLKLVDSNYRYTDLPSLEAHLKKINSDSKKYLPIKVPEGEIIHMNFEPYNETVSYKLDRRFDEEEVEYYRDILNSDSFIKKYCHNSYISNYKIANNVVVNLVFNGLDGNSVASVSLDRERCS